MDMAEEARQELWMEDLAGATFGDGVLIWYDALRAMAEVRRDADGRDLPKSDKAQQAVEGLVEEFSLVDGPLKHMLFAVLTLWHGEKGDNSAFEQAMLQVYNDQNAPLALRAMAAEHISSCYKDNERKKWGMRAKALARSDEDMGECDRAHLFDRITLGEWDKQLISFNQGLIEDAIGRLIDWGHRDAPARLNWLEGVMRDFYSDSHPDVKARVVQLYSRLFTRASQPSAFNRYYLGKARERYATLTEVEPQDRGMAEE